MRKSLLISAVLLIMGGPVASAWAQAGPPGWGVRVLQTSRPERLKYLSFFSGYYPGLTDIEHYGQGYKWLQVTVEVTPPENKSLPIKQISLDGHPLLAIAYQALPSHSIEYKFVAQEEGLHKEEPKPKKASPSEISGQKFSPSGAWSPLYLQKAKSRELTEFGKGYFEGGNRKKMILVLFTDKGPLETRLGFEKEGSTNIILLFAAPAAAEQLQLSFGDAVVPVVMTAPAGPAPSAAQDQSDPAGIIQAGKKLLANGEYHQAIIKFLEALARKGKEEIVEAYLYISYSYYALDDKTNCLIYLIKLFEIQPGRELDEKEFAPKFVELFNKTKSEVLGKNAPAGGNKAGKAEERLKEPEGKPEPVVKVKPGSATRLKKKGRSVLWVAGALAVGGGVTAALLLANKESSSPPPSNKGSIQVSSTPSGAKVYLDSVDTGRTTNCTLTNVDPGTRAVKLVRDGYVDYIENIMVVAGQTANVTASLTKNSIAVTDPAAGATWRKGTTVDIKWNVVPSTPAQRRTSMLGLTGLPRTTVLQGRSFRSSPGLRAAEKDTARARRRDAGGRDPEAGHDAAATGNAGLGRDQTPFPAAPVSGDVKAVSPQAHSFQPALRPRAGGVSSGISALGISKVKIELYKGGTLAAVPAPETDNNGIYSWQVSGSLTSGTDYRVRISCSTDASVYGESGIFTVTDGSINVTQPASGATWARGSSYDIQWTSGVSGNVKIELYKETSIVQTVVEDTANDGIHNWTVPTGLADGVDYKIKIALVSDPSTFGESAFFTIGANLYEFVAKWGSQGTLDGQFVYPEAVAVDSSGNVYVADTDNHRIQKFTSSGGFLAKWGNLGSGNGEFRFPTGVAVDSSGFVYVVDSMNSRVEKFTPTGGYVTQWGSHGSADGQLSTPHQVTVDIYGYVYVDDGWNGRVQKFTSTGGFVAKWGTYGTGAGQLGGPVGVAVDASGNVYVADSSNHRVHKFASTGGWLATWGTEGTGNGQFSYPHCIAVDDSGDILVADSSNDRIQKFTSAGGYLLKWGVHGTADGQFIYPMGIELDSLGYVYVVDYENHRIQKFR